jgi:hypothetical protein
MMMIPVLRAQKTKARMNTRCANGSSVFPQPALSMGRKGSRTQTARLIAVH